MQRHRSKVNNENVTILSDGRWWWRRRRQHDSPSISNGNTFVASIWAATELDELCVKFISITNKRAHIMRSATVFLFSGIMFCFFFCRYVRRAYLLCRMSTEQAHINTKRKTETTCWLMQLFGPHEEWPYSSPDAEYAYVCVVSFMKCSRRCSEKNNKM